ncbi:hypothetical protein GUITHDRAFT_156241 [Guillardia theta CCMP2712]|uniref:Uncharacterized protein n=2 Tax=Guillardia theta TaxID=55529 RepID=L1IA82_GUITC|nr:hypothetical protein GUITHDRAFT_156241 [Guillardia theta CCMP2712]EKX32784.1 hypothetical protein GUITHDRAFT_156241 [Guillardia theta CCMP2712]|eukprot:XP_005819764.1 hypothetical protein GUITHDRAFT_156241 [Guillardia theta CCMP2712]
MALHAARWRAVGAALMAAVVVCALVASLRWNSSSSRSVLASSAGEKPKSEFKKDWKRWLNRVDMQVKAAVQLSNGLSQAKKAKLVEFVHDDLVGDMKREQKIVNDLDKKYGVRVSPDLKFSSKTESSKAAHEAAQPATHAAVHHKAAAHQGKNAPYIKIADKQAIDHPLSSGNREGVAEFGRVISTKVARDDAKIAQAKAAVSRAEHRLEAEEKSSMSAADVVAVEKSAPVAKSHRARAAHAQHKIASKAASKHAEPQDNLSKHVLAMKVPYNKAKAEAEAQQEESSWDSTLSKLGLASNVQTAKKDPFKFPSQLRLPGQSS